MAKRAWCWTLNNFTDEDRDSIKSWCEAHGVRYAVYGVETGESGTLHLQGYTEMMKPTRMSGMKKLPGLGRAHLEARQGTRDQARTYCMKDGAVTEIGDWSAGGQGTRNDLRSMMNAVKADPSAVLEHMESDPKCYSRHQRFIEKYTQVIEKETTREFRKVDVQVLHGDAGCGKTRYVMDKEPKVFTVNTDEAFPFDGYSGEEAILLDDFYGGIKYHNLLRILDGHQLRVNVKGGSRYARWTRVYITSNSGPSEWYRNGLTPALKRRLTSVTVFGNEVGGNTDPHFSLEI